LNFIDGKVHHPQFIPKVKAMAFKRMTSVWVALVSVMFVYLASAQGTGGTNSSQVTKLFSYGEANLLYYHFGYKEDVPPPYKSTENGWFPGISVAVTRQEKGPTLYARGSGEFAGAHTTYDGTTQSGSPVHGETENKFFNVEGDLGFSLPAPGSSSLALYSGLGYRYWQRSLKGAAPYREQYHWKYVPAGLRWDLGARGPWGEEVDLAAKFMTGGKIKVYMTDIWPTLYDINMTLGNRTGWRLLVPIHYKFWTFTPWYEYSAIGQSNSDTLYLGRTPVAVGYEPSSAAHQFGLNLGARVALR
jgi:hypothetical protein